MVALIQSDWYPNEKKFGHTERQEGDGPQRKEPMRTQ